MIQAHIYSCLVNSNPFCSTILKSLLNFSRCSSSNPTKSDSFSATLHQPWGGGRGGKHTFSTRRQQIALLSRPHQRHTPSKLLRPRPYIDPFPPHILMAFGDPAHLARNRRREDSMRAQSTIILLPPQKRPESAARTEPLEVLPGEEESIGGESDYFFSRGTRGFDLSVVGPIRARDFLGRDDTQTGGG